MPPRGSGISAGRAREQTRIRRAGNRPPAREGRARPRSLPAVARKDAVIVDAAVRRRSE